SGRRLLLVSPPIAPDSSVAPPPGSPLPATPSWHALPVSRLWSTHVSASPPALAYPALPSLHRGAAARRSSHLLVSPDDCSPVDSPHGLRLQLREHFGTDLPVLCLHSDRGEEFSSDLLREFCRGEGILQLFTLPDSPQQNGIVERRIGLVMEPHVSLPETSPTLRWTGKARNASVFRVWGSRAFNRDMFVDKLSAHTPCVFLGFVPDAPGWQFYNPTSRGVLPSQDVTLQPASPLPAPSSYTEQSDGLTEHHGPAFHPVSTVHTARRAPRLRHPPVPGTHAMALRLSSVPLHVPLPTPPESSLPEVPNPAFDRARAASPTVSRLLAIAVTDTSFESAAVFALVAELLDFAAACCVDYTTALVAESVSATPLSLGGECALGTDVLEDRQEDFECLAAAVPRFASMLLAPEGDPDAPDIPTPRSYAKAITGTYVDKIPPPGANIVDGMWIFRVKRPPDSPPAFKARYVARGFSHRAFLQGSLHEEIWLRRPPGFTGSFPVGTQWSLRRPVHGLRQAPHEWHDTVRTTLAALGFTPSTAGPFLILRTDTSLPLFYILVYVDGLVFATADTEALTLVKSTLQKRHTCTDLGPSALRLPVILTIAHSSVYRPLALSSTFGRVSRSEWSIPRACGLSH
ncbi:unnamed protein product, partial [Closterium sp. NIES-54]